MILAIDQGTTGTTCIVFDDWGRPAGRAYREFKQHFPRPGWVEHDAAEVWDVTRAVAHEALAGAGADGRKLVGIGITNQRETVVAWDPDTGEPLHRAIVWQDRRTAARCDELRAAGHEPLVRERTGFPIGGGVKVRATVTAHERGKKIHGLKFKPKKGYKRRYGHRADLTRLEIDSIAAKASRSRGARKQQEDDDGTTTTG